MKLHEVTSSRSVDPWAAEMMKASGLSGSPNVDMSDTGDGRYFSSEKADKAVENLKAAGHKVKTTGSWVVVAYKGGKKGMSFDYDDIEAGGERNGKVAVRFWDDSKST